MMVGIVDNASVAGCMNGRGATKASGSAVTYVGNLAEQLVRMGAYPHAAPPPP